MKREKVSFTTENGRTEEFFVEEETRIGGVNYLLVTDSDGEEANACILKDLSEDGDEEANFGPVEDDTEFHAVAGVFQQMLEDTVLVQDTKEPGKA